MNILKRIRVFHNDLRKKAEIAKGNNAYLFNCWMDADGLSKLFKNIPDDRAVWLYALDGTKIEIKPAIQSNVIDHRRPF